MTSVLCKTAIITLTLAASPVAAQNWRGTQAVSDKVLAEIRGTGGTTTLSLLTQDVGDNQAQFVGEDLRVGFANWFADDNIQIIANSAMIRGI